MVLTLDDLLQEVLSARDQHHFYPERRRSGHGNGQVAKGHCCPSAPSEPCLQVSLHTAQAHHEQHRS